MIDTHCHLTYDPLFDQIDDVLLRAAEAGVDRMISVGTTLDDARKASELASQHKNLFSTVGVHPHYADEWTDKEAVQKTMRELAVLPHVVALGEMGLDKHYSDPPIESQQRVLGWQLEVAADSKLPIIIHNREATDQTLSILQDSGIAPQRFVFHCFTGDLDEFDAILNFGAMISFTGITTFKSAAHLGEAAAKIPDDRIMVETDSPYLTPEPHRKVRPNEPRYVVDVARFIAEKRGMTQAAFIELADRNAVRFFGLPQ